ncbi:MAG: TonB-dependent receptor [Acidobacteriia bacterium]|nr:TonB-dependent receptor [Terriglobia bacterium]
MLGRRPITLGLITGLAILTPVARSASLPVPEAGIFGQVKSAGNVAQMGASVLLYDRYDQLVRRVLTNAEGKFVFDKLAPDVYSIRVSLASFVPALRRNIAVAAGSENLLQINLANLFSTIDLISSGPARGTLMSDDWKWVLRSSQATRPVLRMLPVSSSASTQSAGSVFSNTTGLVKVSASDGESFASGSVQDLGTAFALATSIFGSGRVLVSGNVGYTGNSTIPEAGFRTTYTRTPDGATGPQVTLTVRQLSLPSHGETSPVLRTASLAMRDRIDLNDNLHLEYGLTTESVVYLHRVSSLSPFARATYDLGRNGSVRFSYSNGTQPGEAASHNAGPETSDALNQDLAALALLPRVSRRDGELQLQRTQNFELGYEIVEGSRTFSIGAYSEAVTNAAFTLSGSDGVLPWTDALPDLGTNDSIFNAGSYHRNGLTVGVKQEIADHFEVAVAAGRTGALTMDPREAAVNTGDSLRGLIRDVDRPWVTVGFAATLPRTGTYIMSNYGWTDPRVMMPDHVYMTQDVTQSTGWNVRIRQPLPFLPGIGGRLEATAELRNLLAQGYLPIDASCRKAILTHSPRAVRGGLAFIF